MKRRYRWSLPAWAVAQREEYYAQMAARGLFVQRCGMFLTRFERGEPAERIYRLDAAEQRNSEPEPERLRLYESCGWQFVCKSDWFHLYSAAPGTTELHTDAEFQSETLAPVRRSLRSDVIGKSVYAVFWVFLLFVNGMAFSRGMTLADSVCLAFVQLGWVLPLLLAFVAAQVFFVAEAFLSFSRYVRRLRAGERPDRRALRRSIRRHRASGALAAALTIALIASFLSLIPHSTELDGAPGSEHLIRLEQLDPDAEPFTGTGLGGIESGTVDVCATPLASFQLDCTQLSGPDGATPSLFQHYIEVRVPVDARAAAQAMARRSFLYDAAPVAEQDLPEGVEFALVNSRMEETVELCAVRGNRILIVQYIGGSVPAADVLAFAAEALSR